MSVDAKYLHVKELAAEWRQDPATIYRKIKRGEIPAVRLGGGHSALRIPVDELEAFLHGGAPPPQSPATGGAVLPPSRPEGAE
jgi:excisionase family DNA binding protein